MKRFSDFFDKNKRLLLAIASTSETATVLKALNYLEAPPADWRPLYFDSFSILKTGVGKANAAGAVACELTLAQANNSNYAAVLSFGIAGSLKDDIQIGSTVLGSKFVFADEGTPFVGDRQWMSLETEGWAQTEFPSAKTDWLKYLRENADYYGAIATVSTISGTDDIAKDYEKRTGALAEGMEGAAIAQVCLRFDVPFGEYRIISNRCGNRNVNKLDIPTSFRRLSQIAQSWGLTLAAGATER